jgi:hypothetical protein
MRNVYDHRIIWFQFRTANWTVILAVGSVRALDFDVQLQQLSTKLLGILEEDGPHANDTLAFLRSAPVHEENRSDDDEKTG